MWTFSANAIPQDTQSLEAETFVLGVQNFDFFPHYNFTDQNKNSLLEEVLALFELKTGIKLRAVALPTKRLEYAFFESKEVDLIYPANKRWYKDKPGAVHYSNSLVTSISGTMVIEKGLPLKKIRAISIPFGFTPVKWNEEQDARQVQIFGVPDAKMAMQMVVNHRVQAADVEYNVAEHLNLQYGYDLVLDTNLPLSNPEFQFASIKHPQLITLLNQFLAENKDEIATIKRQLYIKESIASL
ncbi:hypothetical protein [Planctobacterium marinum]|uniref:hypothetical protein n=1 Tax=Planctobacterium marinum TaxID=1631968 RepID=UPI0030C73D56